MKRFLCLLAAILFILTGCREEDQLVVDPSVTESLVWETMPTLTYGRLEYEKLKVEPWYCGRTEATSSNHMAETEQGYYYMNSSGGPLWLYYCDKENPGNWVRVCGNPSCTHSTLGVCSAIMLYDTIFIKEGRIYYLAQYGTYPELNHRDKSGDILVSRAMDGSDLRLEYVLEDALLTGGGSCSSELTSGYWVYSSAKLNADGQYEMGLWLMNDSGVHPLHQETLNEEKTAIVTSAGTIMGLLGDAAWLVSALDGNLCYRVKGDVLEPVDLNGLNTAGAYLSGNVLRCFKPNDGYYDVDLSTRQEVKLAEARMENSHCMIVLPNCVVEGTLLGAPSRTTRTEGMTHGLSIFDGESWRDVELPEELKNAGKNEFIFVQAVTSDSILFGFSDATGLTFYGIDLSAKQWKLELVNPQ